jgi:hypothetical protein
VFSFVLQERFAHAAHDNPPAALALRKDQDYAAILEGTSLWKGLRSKPDGQLVCGELDMSNSLTKRQSIWAKTLRLRGTGLSQPQDG